MISAPLLQLLPVGARTSQTSPESPHIIRLIQNIITSQVS
jgi:hypothetical protein